MITKLKFVFTVVAVVLNLQWVLTIENEKVKNVIETLVVVDKEFADLYQQDYKKIADYLTIYFWDVNSRFKSLWSVDVSIQIVDLLIIKDKGDQPFVENARGSNGTTNYKTIINLFQPWLYEKRNSSIEHDLAILITNSAAEIEKGIGTLTGVCKLDIKNRLELGTVVVYDRGQFRSMGICAHEIGHTLGAEHDDDVQCPPGFLMHHILSNNIFFFSNCSDSAISTYVNSEAASCLRKMTAVKNTTIDTYFSTPKAGNMTEVCKNRFGSQAKIDKGDLANCTIMKCQSLDKNNNYITNLLLETVENIQCINGTVNGRCFRGKCRPESKLLQHEASGKCLKPESGFGVLGAAVMVTCPTIKEKTPLDTIAIMDSVNYKDGKLLASPYLAKQNTESGDKCIWMGDKDTDTLWADKCDPSNSWMTWNLKPSNTNPDAFYLVNQRTGKCVRPTSNDNKSLVQSANCSSDNNLTWKWFEGL